jgi:hypothetical protein
MVDTWGARHRSNPRALDESDKKLKASVKNKTTKPIPERKSGGQQYAN